MGEVIAFVVAFNWLSLLTAYVVWRERQAKPMPKSSNRMDRLEQLAATRRLLEQRLATLAPPIPAPTPEETQAQATQEAVRDAQTISARDVGEMPAEVLDPRLPPDQRPGRQLLRSVIASKREP